MNQTAAGEQTERRLDDTVRDTPELENAILLAYSGDRDINWRFASGEVGGEPAQPSHPYHAASIGKTFTATIVGMLVEEGKLAFEDLIHPYFDDELLDGLHEYKGTEYTDGITIHHLLSHTSGLPHFHPEEHGLFNRKPEKSPAGDTFFDVMLADPDRFWEPEESTHWAKENLTPHFPPSGGCYYSEVGYNLLGLIIEGVTGNEYAEVLADRIFDPLGMAHSYLAQFSEPSVKGELPVMDFSIGDRVYGIDSYRSFSAW